MLLYTVGGSIVLQNSLTVLCWLYRSTEWYSIIMSSDDILSRLSVLLFGSLAFSQWQPPSLLQDDWIFKILFRFKADMCVCVLVNELKTHGPIFEGANNFSSRFCLRIPFLLQYEDSPGLCPCGIALSHSPVWRSRGKRHEEQVQEITQDYWWKKVPIKRKGRHRIAVRIIF